MPFNIVMFWTGFGEKFYITWRIAIIKEDLKILGKQKQGKNMITSTEFLDFLGAAHYTYMVNSDFRARGGIMLIGNQESLKTTFVRALEDYGSCLILSDLTTKSFSALRHDIADGILHTLGFDDFAMLFKRRDYTAAQIQGVLQSLVEEGVTRLHWENSRAFIGNRARALVVAAMTRSFFESRSEEWREAENEGFMRRFLWCHISLENPRILIEAIHNWKRWNLTSEGAFRLPIGTSIPHDVDRDESEEIEGMLDCQKKVGGGGQTPNALLHKILSVLKWVYRARGSVAEPMDLLRQFSEAFDIDVENGLKIRIETTFSSVAPVQRLNGSVPLINPETVKDTILAENVKANSVKRSRKALKHG
jgi:hypothetical protein